MRVLKMALIATVVVGIAGCGGSTALRSGKVYLQKNRDYPKAEEWFRKAIEENPDNWEGYYWLGWALAEQEKYAEANTVFTKARELAPEGRKQIVHENHRSFFVDHYKRGVTALETRNLEGAVEQFTMAVTLYSEDSNAYNNLGVAYSRLGDNENALEAFKRASEVDPSSISAWKNLGGSYMAANQPDLAKEAFEKIIEIDPGDAEASYSLGDSYFRAGDYEIALQHYTKSAEKLSDNALLHYQIGASYFRLEDYGNAVDAFMESARLSKDSDILTYEDAMFNLGVAYVQLEQYDTAVAVLQRLLEVQDTAEIHEVLGRAYARQGMQDKALEELRKAEEIRAQQ
jgi:tetratricopeptide (TPR) repeat protein